ncbi:uracil-DNA glycosylase [Nocardioides sp. SOB44]|uniref:Uracil-DNA glycosylase n=1 Tax=Nocardioides cremeus TaxID=3058044 RepID=A0ABT8TX94_9ACTN|nr:uracil-DNA glycosylase [Nocardioides cremeus]MDO3397593.1 uracil-DNA glycosylase [Nocardioides cremeus]
MNVLDELVDQGRMAPDWAQALAPVAHQVEQVREFLRAETAAGRPWLPGEDRLFRAFERPLAQVRVLLVGQDPYPTPGHPVGLSFSVDAAVRPVPRSLANIYRELEDDLGHPPPPHGDLTAWADSGVMLLNRVLSVRAGAADSHRGRGWEQVTEQAVRALGARGGPLVALLWGARARGLAGLLGSVPVVASAHPSPLSAYRGFLGSRPFSQVDRLLVEQGGAPVDWALPADPAQISR